MAADDELSIWVICKNPSDYPGKYTARRHVTGAKGTFPTDEVLVSADLEVLRTEMFHRGMISIGRFHWDDPVIVESWV